jgi:hypothetical protein
LLADTYKGAQDQLKNAIAGEQVVSTGLEKRGRGGRTEAKKRKAAVAVSSSIVNEPDSRSDAANSTKSSCSTAACTVVDSRTAEACDAPSRRRRSSPNSSIEGVEIFGDSYSSSSLSSSDEDLAISKVVGEIQLAKKRTRISVPEVVEQVKRSSSNKATNQTASIKKTNIASANLPKIPEVPSELGINQLIPPHHAYARKSLPPGKNNSFI